MAIASERVKVLKHKHATLDDAIRVESRRPHPDDLRLKELKVEKLRVKDEITVLTAA